MFSDPFIYLCGALGAAIYAVPVLLAALSSVPPGRFAYFSLGFAIVVGTVCAPLATSALGNWKPWLVVPTPYPLAAGVGLLANRLVPLIMNKAVAYAERKTEGLLK